MKLQEIQTLVWPRDGKTLNTKTDKFWYIVYISGLGKYKELKIVKVEDKILMYIVSKIQPQIHYIIGDMIPPSYGSILFQDSSLNKTPGENCHILGYKGPNKIYKDFP